MHKGLKVLKRGIKQFSQLFETQHVFSYYYDWCYGAKVGPGLRDAAPRDPGIRDPGPPPQSLKVGPGTPLKFKSETPGPPSKFKSGTPSPFLYEFIFFRIFHLFKYQLWVTEINSHKDKKVYMKNEIIIWRDWTENCEPQPHCSNNILGSPSFSNTF